MKNTFTSGLLALTIIASSSAYSYGQGARNQVDDVLKNADLVKLIGQPEALYLRAQTSDPSASTRNVNDLDSFIVMGIPDSEPARTEIAEFDKNQKIIQKTTYDAPWIGLATYKQNEIPKMSLQDGMDALRPCLLNKEEPINIPDEISALVIYKTQNTNEIVYDYIFKDPTTSQCHEYLYVPDTGFCFAGYRINCHFDINDPLNRNGKK